MAKGQLALVVSSEKIEDILCSSSPSDSLHSTLLLVKEIKQFAEDSLCFDETNNYTSLVVINEENKLWVVDACEPFAFVPYEWDYPILGKMPYRGFFDLEEAKQEEERLKQLGFDTDVSPVEGWSTLGILPDPVLSPMLERSESELCDLLFHELFHSTVFVKNNAVFNENVANFMAEKATERFLISKYGKDSKELKKYRERLSDRKKIKAHFYNAYWILSDFYQSSKGADKPLVKARKEDLFEDIFSSIDTLSLFDSSLTKRYKDRASEFNNTFFYTHRLYNGNFSFFENLYQTKAGSNVCYFIDYLRQEEESFESMPNPQ